VVNKDLPVRNEAELLAYAKATPGKLFYGSAGIGASNHLCGALLEKMAGVQLTHVPYKGSAPAVTDLLGGQIQMMFDPLQSVLQHVVGGKLRAIAVTSASRSPALPTAPTVAESGYKDFEVTAWWGVYAPAGLSAAQAASLASEIEKVVKSSAFRDTLGPLGVLPTVLTLGAFGDFVFRNPRDQVGRGLKRVVHGQQRLDPAFLEMRKQGQGGFGDAGVAEAAYERASLRW